MSVSLGPALDSDPERWLTGAETLPGSWWEPWARWESARSGELRPAPARLGHPCHPVLYAAPASTCWLREFGVGAGDDGPMMETPLNAWLLLENAPVHAPHGELVSRSPDGEVERHTYAEFRGPGPPAQCTPRPPRAGR